MTAPSNANTSGLELVDLNGLLHQAWERLHRSDADVPGALVVLNALHVALEAPLVTAASAQAEITSLAEAVRRAEANETIWSDLADEWKAKAEAADRIIVQQSACASEWQVRATAAEARADRLAKALEAARGTLDAIDCPLTTDRTVAGAAKHAVKRIDAALHPGHAPMTQTPTDALRLVPVRATPQQLETAAFNLSAEIGAAEAMKLGPHIERAYELLVAAAPASPLPGGGWQDISTAPRQERVMLGHKDFKGWFCLAICNALGEWSYDDRPWGQQDAPDKEATHWMPLPAAPTGDA
ncbi:hypothetical protein PFY01_09350 [Brevundimonas vesicularis]|nr:hypothetical protein [Brevundimonas vesicularis]WBT04945.1 hypothetical protein PFY01_09350 [Brevundimonas vesicularis]